MIRFALIVASTLGFVLTAALGNLMTPLLRAFRVRQEENEPPTMGGLCLMVGTLAAVGVGWQRPVSPSRSCWGPRAC